MASMMEVIQGHQLVTRSLAGPLGEWRRCHQTSLKEWRCMLLSSCLFSIHQSATATWVSVQSQCPVISRSLVISPSPKQNLVTWWKVFQGSRVLSQGDCGRLCFPNMALWNVVHLTRSSLGYDVEIPPTAWWGLWSLPLNPGRSVLKHRTWL